MPDEFLPERFNSESPLYLTPDGKNRHSTAFFPFTTGPRSCLGQTLALTELRSLFVYFIWNWTLSVVNKEILEDSQAHFAITTKYTLKCRVEKRNTGTT